MSYFNPILPVEQDVRFYDTSSLLLAGESLFNQDKFVISSITFKELERIKCASNKSPDVKYAARLLLRLFEENPNAYEVVIHKECYEFVIEQWSLEINDDTKILSDAIEYERQHPDTVIFVTNDLCLKNIANLFFGNEMIESVREQVDDYTGYKEVTADDDTMAKFYQEPEVNHFDLLVNQYLILKDTTGEIKDLRVWTGEEHRYLNTDYFKSKWLGKISPYDGDIFQKFAFDSLRNNQITVLKGPAGSGKTLLAINYLFSELEKHNIERIVMFVNPVATLNSAKLGYTPGSLTDKILDSQIGNILSAKLGGRIAVEQLIASEQLVLIPFSNLRGYDTTGMKAGIYLSEAQNLDVTLIKLALQRISEDCICIIDGDPETQTDLDIYKSKNGMKRLSQVFRGAPFYGEVRLQQIYRSRIAKLAEAL